MAAVTLAIGLGACHGALPPDVAQSPPPAEQAAGKAHLYVYLGRVHGQLLSHANGRESDFYINGIDVGSVGSDEFLYVDLEPGVYDFAWRGSHDFLGAVESAHDYDMVQPGQEVFLALNVDRNAGEFIPPLGWWLDPDTGHISDRYPSGRRKIADRHRVRPSPDILARLHPMAGPTTYLPPSW
jgi:hypothetical protein